MIFKYLFLLLISFKACNRFFIQEQPAIIDYKFKKGKSLSEYYSFDNVDFIKLNNIKGLKILSKPTQDSLINLIKGYVMDSTYAKTKPGYIWCLIAFKDGSTLSFYSNAEGEIIISNIDDFTFISKKKVNFDNF